MSAQNRQWQRAEAAPAGMTRLVAFLLLAATGRLGAAPDTDPPPAPVAAALEQLDADSFAARERASHALWQSGGTAEPYLEQALGHPSIEVRMRARRVLQLLRFGLDADATPEHWAFIRQFHSGDFRDQAALLLRMLQQEEAGLALRLLEGSGTTRNRLLAQLDAPLKQMLPAVLVSGDFALARRLVDLLASGGQRMRYAAWFHRLTGTDADATARLAALAAPGALERTRLHYLASARGDTDAAARLAEELQLAGDKRGFGLAEVTPAEFASHSAAATRDEVEVLGFLAAHGRLAGDGRLFGDSIAGLQRIARDNREDRPFCLEAMVINGAVDAAIGSAATAMDPFRIHARQWKVREALLSLGITAQAPPFSPWIENLCASIASSRRLQAREELLAYAYALAELCMQTGEQEEAERLCRLTAAALLESDRLGFQQAIRREAELGLRELAMEHALQALAMGTPEISVFVGLHGKSNQHARNWFDYLRSREDATPMPPGERLRLLDQLLAPSTPGSATRERVTPLITQALAAENPLRGGRKASWPTTLVYTSSLHGIPAAPAAAAAPSSALPRPDAEVRALREAGSAHLEAGRFAEAADAFGQALAASGSEASPQLLFLLGAALIQSGRDAEAGAMRQLQARLVAPLTGDRLGFIEFLWRRGETALVAEECRFLFLDDDSGTAGADARLFGVVAEFLADTDPLRAADLWEMQLLTGLRKQQGATLTRHLEERFRIHHTRALGLRQLGDIAGALRELQLAATMLPADARIAETLSPMLAADAAPARQQAADLLSRVHAAAEAAASQFPGSTMLGENLERIRKLPQQRQ